MFRHSILFTDSQDLELASHNKSKKSNILKFNRKTNTSDGLKRVLFTTILFTSIIRKN